MANDQNLELQIRARNLTKEAFASVSAALKALEDQSEQTSAKGKASWSSWFSTIAGGVTVGNLLSSAFSTVGSLLAKIPGELLELGKRGSDVADVADSFDRLTGSIGESSDAMLGKLRAAFGNTVSDFDLMKSANEVLGRGVVVTAGQMETLAKGARVMADQVGGNAKEAFDSMLTAIGTGMDRGLKQLPLNLANVQKGLDAEARSLGIATAQLDDNAKRRALLNALVAESTDKVRENGEVVNDFGDNVIAMNAQLTNWTDGLGVAIAKSPVLNAALQTVSDSMVNAFGDSKVSLIQSLIGSINTGAIWLAKFARIGLEGAGLMGAAWSALQLVFSVIGAGIVGVAQLAVGAIAGIAKGAAALPGVGDQFQGVARSLADLQVQLGGMRESFERDTRSAWEGVKGKGAYFDTINKGIGSIDAMIAKMSAASATTVSAEKIQAQLNKRHEEGAQATGALTKQTDEFLKQLKELNAAIANRKSQGDSDESILARFGKDAEKATERGRDLNVVVDTLYPAIAGLSALQGKFELAKIFDGLPKVKNGIDDLKGALESLEVKNGPGTKDFNELSDAYTKAQDRMVLATKRGVALRLAEIKIAERDEIQSYAHLESVDKEKHAAMLGSTKAFYQQQRDLAIGTYSTIERRMAEQGVFSKRELQTQADEARRDYEQMKAAGTFTWAEIAAAAKRAEDAQKKAVGVDLRASMGELANTLGNLASVTDGSFSRITKWLSETIKNMNAAHQAGKEFKESLKEIDHALSGTKIDWSGLADGLANAIGAAISAGILVWQATDPSHKNTAQTVVGGALAGGQIGDSTGIPGAGLVGMGAGALIGWWRSAHAEWKRVARDVGRDIGVDISDGLAQQIADLEKTLKGGTKEQRRKIAEMLSLSAIIAESGGLNEGNVQQWALQARGLFDVVQKGGADGAAAVTELGKVFGQLASVTDLTKHIANESLIAIVRQARESGTTIAEVDQFVDQMNQQASAGFNALAGGFAGLVTGAAAAAKEGKDLTAVMSGAVGSGQASFDRLGRFATLAADNIRATGGNLFDVFDQIGSGLDSLTGAQGAYNYTVQDGGLQNLLAVRQVLTANQELGQMVVGLNDLMIGTANTGRVNQGVFSDLAAQAVENETALEAAGLSRADAMDTQRETLQGLYELQQRYNLTLTDEQQELLNAAEAAGLVGDAQKSASERMVDGINKVVDRMDLLLRKMGVELPGAMDTGASKAVSRAKDLANGVNSELGKIQTRINVDVDVTRRERTVTEGGGGDDSGDGDSNSGASARPRITVDVQGNANGGLFTKPTFRVFAEKGPEVVGAPNAIVDAFSAALQQSGTFGSLGQTIGSSVGSVLQRVAKVSTDEMKAGWWELLHRQDATSGDPKPSVTDALLERGSLFEQAVQAAQRVSLPRVDFERLESSLNTARSGSGETARTMDPDAVTGPIVQAIQEARQPGVTVNNTFQAIDGPSVQRFVGSSAFTDALSEQMLVNPRGLGTVVRRVVR